MKRSTVFLIVVASVVFSSAISALIVKMTANEPVTIIQNGQPARFTNYSLPAHTLQPADFTYAASITTPGVVHVTSKRLPQKSNNNYYNPFRDFFGDDFWG